MNDERCDRDRVTAILSIRFALTPDEEWLARTLLAALDTIDKARALHQPTPEWVREPVCKHCGHDWPCPDWQALNGGNE